jgi:hypothetical protein
MRVDTAKASRRRLRFASVDHAIAEADRLVAAAAANRLTLAGNWTLGQILNHLAAWAEFAYTGVPLKIPFIVRLLARPLRGRILRKGFSAGRNIPNVKGGTLATDDLPLPKALQRFQIAYLRLKSESPPLPHPIFGRMTGQQWIALNLRRAELHMSFANPT